ncbi:MAG: hypothetical protein D6780_06940 [Candidatus Dadabacteria bacterium]|nr:MAG: hypothetical protein D6780_06940 [Candidatus Dadabacteria bacterium]
MKIIKKLYTQSVLYLILLFTFMGCSNGCSGNTQQTVEEAVHSFIGTLPDLLGTTTNIAGDQNQNTFDLAVDLSNIGSNCLLACGPTNVTVVVNPPPGGSGDGTSVTASTDSGGNVTTGSDSPGSPTPPVPCPDPNQVNCNSVPTDGYSQSREPQNWGDPRTSDQPDDNPILDQFISDFTQSLISSQLSPIDALNAIRQIEEETCTPEVRHVRNVRSAAMMISALTGFTGADIYHTGDSPVTDHLVALLAGVAAGEQVSVAGQGLEEYYGQLPAVRVYYSQNRYNTQRYYHAVPLQSVTGQLNVDENPAARAAYCIMAQNARKAVFEYIFSRLVTAITPSSAQPNGAHNNRREPFAP